MNRKDWTGNKNSVYKTLAASNHTEDDRETYDYYATEPKATEWLLKLTDLDANLWEPACGEGHMANVLKDAGHNVRASDIINRGYGEQFDFLGIDCLEWGGDIVTNPPYAYAHEFILKALSIINPGKRVAMFLKVQFLEGKGRKTLFLHFPPKYVFISCGGLECAKNGNFTGQSAVAYAWYIWEKGFKGETLLKWFN